MKSVSSKLSNAQLELLKSFSRPMSDEEFEEFRQHIVSFHANKARDAADKVWQEESWDDKKVEELLNTKLRKRD